MSDTIICYDIACPRRLARVHRHLVKCAAALQYSVFLFSGTDAALDQCLAVLEKLIDSRHDDVRAYPLPHRGARLCMGRATLPGGIHLGSLPAPWSGALQPSAPARRIPESVRSAQSRDDHDGTTTCIIV